jgi:hypothetical protein
MDQQMATLHAADSVNAGHILAQASSLDDAWQRIQQLTEEVRAMIDVGGDHRYSYFYFDQRSLSARGGDHRYIAIPALTSSLVPGAVTTAI